MKGSGVTEPSSQHLATRHAAARRPGGRPSASNGPPRFDLDRGPVVAFWEITQACALACLHCRAKAQSKRHPLELDTAECFRVMNDLATFEQKPILVLSGGDPFMRRDIFDLVEHGVGLGLTISVSPSATALVTRDRLQRLKDLGVSRISLSLDGSNANNHDSFRGVVGSFMRTLKAMSDAGSVGLTFQVNTTVSRHSLQDLPAIEALAASSGAALWDVFFLVPVGRAQVEDAISPEEHERVFHWLLEQSRQDRMRIKTTLAMHYRRVQVQERLRELGQDAYAPSPDVVKQLYTGVPSNDGKGIMFISHLGEIYPSGFLPLTTGNVRRDSVVETYRNSELFRSLRDPASVKGKCGQCPFNVICGGSRARAYGVTGDPFAAEPSCVYQPAPA